MLQAYRREGLEGEAVFSLYVRGLPPQRSYIVACGLADALDVLEGLRFDESDLEGVRALGGFTPDFLDFLRGFRFTGDVYAVPEGTPLFAEEPILEVVAPLPEAQLVETILLNQVHLQTVLASKAARVVAAARGRPVVDFALRRMHGIDAGLKGARAFFIAGVEGTSNVLAALRYGIPARGTMAHAYVQAHAHEADAFRAFASLYPGTTLLVDTTDTIEGVRRAVRLAREGEIRFGAVRLDSGDLGALAKEARRILDDSGLRDVKIFASGGLDEHEIDALLRAGAPIDAFGVGTAMGASTDAPTLDIVYKLVAYEGEGVTKLSPRKAILPGRKQVFRIEEGGRAARDVIARADEWLPGRPLLAKVMERGRILARPSLGEIRARAAREIARLPERVRALEPADPPYRVEVSAELARAHQMARERRS